MFRETLEASIIVSVLLGLVEQIVKNHKIDFTNSPGAVGTPNETKETYGGASTTLASLQGVATLSNSSAEQDEVLTEKRLLRKLRIQVCDQSSCFYPRV